MDFSTWNQNRLACPDSTVGEEVCNHVHLLIARQKAVTGQCCGHVLLIVFVIDLLAGPNLPPVTVAIGSHLTDRSQIIQNFGQEVIASEPCFVESIKVDFRESPLDQVYAISVEFLEVEAKVTIQAVHFQLLCVVHLNAQLLNSTFHERREIGNSQPICIIGLSPEFLVLSSCQKALMLFLPSLLGPRQ